MVTEQQDKPQASPILSRDLVFGRVQTAEVIAGLVSAHQPASQSTAPICGITSIPGQPQIAS